MAQAFILNKTAPDGNKFAFTGLLNYNLSSSGMGCHAYILTSGGVSLSTVTKNGFPVGNNVDAWGRVKEGALAKSIKEAYGKEDLQEALEDVLSDCYVHMIGLLGNYASYAIVMGDRVNRGTIATGAAPGTKAQKNPSLMGSTAAFAAFLARNAPKYGQIYGSPVYSNPLHKSSTDYSLCRTWVWLPKEAAEKMFIPENDPIIGPDDARFPVETASKKMGKSLEELRVTYL